jgi:hypothetical protein
MLLAENGLDGGAWLGIGSVIGALVTAAGAIVIKLTTTWFDRQRVKERDAISDYQRIVDVTEAARDKAEAARDKVVADNVATITENLRLKVMVADKDEELACKSREIEELRAKLGGK